MKPDDIIVYIYEFSDGIVISKTKLSDLPVEPRKAQHTSLSDEKTALQLRRTLLSGGVVAFKNVETETTNAALIEGEQSGEAQPFNSELFKKEMIEKHGD